MDPEKRLKEQVKRLKTMGLALLGLAISFSLLAYFIPTNETLYWLSSRNKEGVYAISGFLAFLGIYCLGATWRRQHFI
ncbi:putative membrane protein [Candidatus Protochlamydia naegleriophila]|uniref:Putative membrane protein n=1 Tax=Candidatus Protochlamydia naegleriophila TaxID=389348 RepID=A0A0U5JBS9_9BACT|nr:putative membrane protein [Candidatus Protochlamydia naegleriophila]